MIPFTLSGRPCANRIRDIDQVKNFDRTGAACNDNKDVSQLRDHSLFMPQVGTEKKCVFG